MTDSAQLRTFLDDYAQYIERVLQPTKEEIKQVLRDWKDPGYWAKYATKTRLPAPSPVQRVFARVKRLESVVDKIFRKPGDFPQGLATDSARRMTDAIGARVVVYFMANLPLIDRELQSMERLEISQDPPPVAYLREDIFKRLGITNVERKDKDSGYASIHYMARLRQSAVPVEERPWIEVQVRTLAEDLWGEIEHILGYKPDKRTSFAVRRQFQILSSMLVSVDEHFNFLYEELARFQDEVKYRDTDPLNAENLPPVLAECGIGCAQQEIDGLLKLLVSRGVGRVRDITSLATPSRLDIIRNTYRNELGRPPINFEIVANLANLKEAKTEDEQVQMIRAHIAYLEAWDTLKKGRRGEGS